MFKLYNENCLDTLGRMNNNSVDLVITSPPYNMNLRISKGRYHSRQIVKEISTKYENFSDNLPIDKFYSLHSKILKELLRVSNLVFYNIAIVTGSKRAFFKMIGDFSDNLKDIIVWDKLNGVPAIQEQVMNRRTELILVFENEYPISRQFKSTGKFERGTLDDLWQIKRERSKDKSHGATFPTELVKKILENFSCENDTVYDAFTGTGTTGLVARQMNRHFIGSEIDPDTHRNAYNKIMETMAI